MTEPKAVYVIGGAGTGKSTFMRNLLGDIEFGPLVELFSLRNRKALVTLRGHYLTDGGLYLGCMRESFPGTDGLDRASSPVGEAWLQIAEELPPYIVAEGATLATRRFLKALYANTDLLLVHLVVDPLIADLRFIGRGSSQDPRFVTNTVTRSSNLYNDMLKIGVQGIEVDTEYDVQWWGALAKVARHLTHTTTKMAG